MFVNGIEVNHQFDKSSAFLARAVDYIRTYIADSSSSSNSNQVVTIQSPIRCMWELQIARVFCSESELQCFHSLFLSCNEPTLDASSDGGFDWCLQCDKCSFIFLLLSAWLQPSAVTHLFHGRSLFQDDAAQSSFMKLIGKDKHNEEEEEVAAVKPFDCVGTIQESSAAIHLTLLRFIFDGLDRGDAVAEDADAKEEVESCVLMLTPVNSDDYNTKPSKDFPPHHLLANRPY